MAECLIKIYLVSHHCNTCLFLCGISRDSSESLTSGSVSLSISTIMTFTQLMAAKPELGSSQSDELRTAAVN